MSDRVKIDPLGRSITLHGHTWYGHILVNHPEVARHRNLVESAIESPLKIEASGSDPDCRKYYGQGPRPAVMMHVVVDVALGLVKTAYFTKQFSGGAEEWPSSTP